MSTPDFNLLITLDALLSEGSVAGAARRLGLSQSAMSRALARLRKTTGDPLLVRAGRGLVPTPRALELQSQIGPLVDAAHAALTPQKPIDLSRLERTFTLRTGEGFVETFGAALIEQVAQQAPKVKLRFVAKPDKDSAPLREAYIDLETGVIDADMGPEIRTQGLYRDRFIGVVRKDHPLLDNEITAESYANARHIAVSRKGIEQGPVDRALQPLGLKRNLTTMVAGFATALSLTRSSDLAATVPETSTQALRAGLESFTLPFTAPEVTVSLFWHPRMDADPGHRWLRAVVHNICKQN